MSEVSFKEYSNMSYEDQLKHVEDKIQRVRESKQKNAESIRQLEGFIENCNEQIEVLLEMKFNVLHQQRMEETLDSVKKNVFGD
jgi:phage shock protein A